MLYEVITLEISGKKGLVHSLHSELGLPHLHLGIDLVDLLV